MAWDSCVTSATAAAAKIMPVPDVALISWVSLVSSALTPFMLLGLILQLRSAGNAQAAQDLIHMKSTVLAGLSALDTAQGEQRRTRFIHVLGLFESVAALVNGNSISQSGRRMWKPYLAEMMDTLFESPLHRSWAQSVITDNEVLQELRRFRAANASLFRRDDLVLEALTARGP
jgi:divalent metal cation (Fe/Co/Zn/Cd) transporter